MGNIKPLVLLNSDWQLILYLLHLRHERVKLLTLKIWLLLQRLLIIIVVMLFAPLIIIVLLLLMLSVMLIFRDCDDLRLLIFNDLVAILVLVHFYVCIFIHDVYHILNFLELMQVLVNVMIFIFIGIINLVSTLEGSYQIIIIFEVIALFIGMLLFLFRTSFAIFVRFAWLIVWEFMLVFLTWVIKALVVIVTTEFVETILVEKVAIRVVET